MLGSTCRLIPAVAPYNIVELDRPEASRTEASARSHPGSARGQTRDATPFDHSIRKRSIANPEVRSAGDAGFARPGGSQEGLRSAERFRDIPLVHYRLMLYSTTSDATIASSLIAARCTSRAGSGRSNVREALMRTRADRPSVGSTRTALSQSTAVTAGLACVQCNTQQQTCRPC